jgi:hypothetical protein
VGSEAIHDASNAIAQVETVEINDDSKLLPAKFKAGDNLRLMDCSERFHGKGTWVGTLRPSLRNS